MALVKAEGIVIRAMKMGETSKLVTLFTRELGLLKVVAKGSRASKSRFGAALEPLTVTRVVYYEKENRELQFLSQAEIAEHFPQLTRDLEKWGFAHACCELITRSHADSEIQPRLYPILLDTLRTMNEPEAEGRACLWGFQMKLFGALGVAPNLRQCLNCRKASPALAADENGVVAHMDIPRGGFFCINCPPAISPLGLTGEALRLLVNFQSLPAGKLSRDKIPPSAHREIDSFFRIYFSFHLAEIGFLSSLKFAREIKRAQASQAGDSASPKVDNN